MKRISCILLVSILLLSSLAVGLADNAPTSQFGFSGWPYRQNTQCTSCSAGCSDCTTDKDCPTCSTCSGASCTAVPVQPTVNPTVQPTTQPTAKPTTQPTVKPTTQPTAKPTQSTDDYTTETVSAQEQKALNLLNADRAANGLPALTLDPELSRIARTKSCDMKANNYFAHNSPTYGSAADMLRTFGYSFNGVGENIAHHANVDKAEAAFMSSTGHRNNILGSQWTKVGIGICFDANGFIYLTQLFVR